MTEEEKKEEKPKKKEVKNSVKSFKTDMKDRVQHF